MSGRFQTLSPIDLSVVVERTLADERSVERTLARGARAFSSWRRRRLEERCRLVGAFVDAVLATTSLSAEELTLHMGRPCRYAEGELRGFEERARAMIALAPSALGEIELSPRPGLQRFIRRESLGLVLVLAPWNYPWLTAVNAVVPALLAGNVVLLKHSEQTPLVAERMAAAAIAAGLPEGTLQYIHTSHEVTARLLQDERIAHVCFTGSVEGGRAIAAAASSRFIGVGLELGGKDPAYVRSDADLDAAVELLVDGAFFNSGQSCCAVERIYVHRDVHERFVDAFVAATEGYQLGDPRAPETTLGPVVRPRSARFIQTQVDEAVAAGARPLVDPSRFEATARGAQYLPPQVLVDVDHSMRVMREETFGPVVGIMKVSDDEEALKWMNDSPYGLTASIWTRDERAALSLGDELCTGTVFMNRCDYLDPELAWVGVKNSGRGCTLSRVGFEQLSRPKSFYLERS